jgi:hypothetical protein
MTWMGPLKPMKAQRLRQKYERDCGVVVFTELMGISEEELLADLPDAVRGMVTVDEWCAWLESKGFTVTKRKGCPDDIVPRAHLVANASNYEDAQWVYRDADGDVLDPSGGFVTANDERMRSLAFYSEKIRTISVSR